MSLERGDDEVIVEISRANYRAATCHRGRGGPAQQKYWDAIPFCYWIILPPATSVIMKPAFLGIPIAESKPSRTCCVEKCNIRILWAIPAGLVQEMFSG